MTTIAVAGGGGRMGREIIKAVVENPEAALAGGFDQPDHADLGRDLGALAGCGSLKVLLSDDFDQACSGAQVLIDFTAPEGTVQHAKVAEERNLALVVGTTGMDPDQVAVLERAAGKIPVVFAPNMSVGVNVLLRIVEEAARILGPAYDLEIVEAHHKMKVDAPSGTALALARAVAAGQGLDLDQVGVFERWGKVGPRKENEIGVQTVRAGDIVGEHTLMMAGPGERLEFIHRAHSRSNFAQGAVRAALWTIGREPGLYSMRDVLGLG